MCFGLLLLGALSAAGGAQQAPATAAAPAAGQQLMLPPARVKALTDWTYALAINAATWGAPLVTMYNLRYNDVFGPSPKAPPNGIWRMTNVSTPELSKEAGYVTPNVNVVYGFGFLDLGPQPIVLSLPDSGGRYYMVEVCDMWTNAFAYPAGAANGYGGGKYALVGPGWTGTLPPGLQRIDSPTRWVLIQPRVHLKNQADLSGARALLANITTQGLAEFLGSAAPAAPTYDDPAPVYQDATQPVSALDFQNPEQFWEILSRAMNENPPPKDQIAALLPMFKPLGLELGKQWDPSQVNPLVLGAMDQAAANIGQLLNLLPGGRFANGWSVPPPSIGNFGNDYRTRAIVGRVGLTANTAREAIYVYAVTDDAGRPFSGANRYAVTVREKPPFTPPGFWSLTMYDAANNYTVPNSIGRYSLGSDDALAANADGTTTIYVQHEKPAKALASNWLPSASGAFYLILRSYAPGPAMVESLSNPRAYSLPDIQLKQ
jgi:DNA sulfur modification protein DndE